MFFGFSKKRNNVRIIELQVYVFQAYSQVSFSYNRLT